ncbi:SPRY domain-containing SOCS box protein 3 isoform X1 [Syngnathus scovelli]|uniref:SPRY domain-containing SOCS box protein 3 isoform X1 n=1 Tax=Syngnathus scovelli TaxID=161590 RepID=UPI00210FD01B|nr:SPRY domain-containing SOCS box protein 3 isoform X1 [Syngnathus scovelli]
MSQGMDSVTMMPISAEEEEWESQTTTQISDVESEVDDLVTQTGPELMEAVSPSRLAPVLGEAFCQCAWGDEPNPGFGISADCLCGEDDDVDDFDWVWDQRMKSSGAFLSCDDRKVSFHSDYSCGTAAIRGTRELTEGQHFWEVKMTSPVYGTDMMVGIGTAEVNLEKFKYNFGSLLGHDEDSWGLSYTGLGLKLGVAIVLSKRKDVALSPPCGFSGTLQALWPLLFCLENVFYVLYKGLLQHKGEKVDFSSQFGQGSIIGLHLDTWHGTLTIYKNRRCVGVAATRLQNKKLYPMLCSTAAKSSMKVIRACYTPTSLQYLCCTRLRQILPDCPDVLSALELPPGLLALLRRRLGWVFSIMQDEGSGPVVLSACDSPSSEAEHCPESPCGRSQLTPPSSDNESSDPEDYQSKRCRWT